MEEIKHTPLQRESRTLYTLHDTGNRKPLPELTNKYYMNVQYDYQRVTEEEAIKYAEFVQTAVNSYYQLQEENKKLREVLEPLNRFIPSIKDVVSERFQYPDNCIEALQNIETLLSTLNEEKK